MTTREKALVDVLNMGVAEVVTLLARLPDPYARNLRAWKDRAQEVIRQTSEVRCIACGCTDEPVGACVANPCRCHQPGRGA